MILIVEDEPLLLDLLSKILEREGFTVLKAQDGVEALHLYTEHQKQIALVFSDVALPKLGGWTVFLKMKEIDPKVNFILASGYLDPGIKSEMVRAGAKDFIQKPYVPQQVVQAIRRTLQPSEESREPD